MEGRETTELDKMYLLAIQKQSTFKKAQITWLTTKKASPAPTTSPTLVENEGIKGKKILRFFQCRKRSKNCRKKWYIKVAATPAIASKLWEQLVFFVSISAIIRKGFCPPINLVIFEVTQDSLLCCPGGRFHSSRPPLQLWHSFNPFLPCLNSIPGRKLNTKKFVVKLVCWTIR